MLECISPLVQGAHELTVDVGDFNSARSLSRVSLVGCTDGTAPFLNIRLVSKFNSYASMFSKSSRRKWSPQMTGVSSLPGDRGTPQPLKAVSPLVVDCGVRSPGTEKSDLWTFTKSAHFFRIPGALGKSCNETFEDL